VAVVRLDGSGDHDVGGARLKNSEQKKVELWETKATNLLLGFDRNKNQKCSPQWCASNGASGSF
jgi:hypothetical protein